MKAEDQIHVGIVVDDLETTLTTLSDLFGYHRPPSGPRIELISRDVRPGLEQYWAMRREPRPL